MASKDAEYSARHREKRQSQRLPIDFYLDDDFEATIYAKLLTVSNRKQTILNALHEHFEKRNNEMGKIIAKGTIYQLREQYGFDNSAGIEQIEATILESIGYVANIETTCKNNFYVIRYSD